MCKFCKALEGYQRVWAIHKRWHEERNEEQMRNELAVGVDGEEFTDVPIDLKTWEEMIS